MHRRGLRFNDLDNIAISAIPEPGVFALLAAGGVLVLLRRRRWRLVSSLRED